MTLDYSRLRNLTARRIVAALEADGFALERQKGSHRRYVHSDGRCHCFFPSLFRDLRAQDASEHD